MTSWDFSTLAELQALFGYVDYAVLVFVLALSVLIGAVFAWRGQRSTADYLTASGEMSLFPMTMSLACSFISAITILGTPAEMYVYGTQYWMIGEIHLLLRCPGVIFIIIELSFNCMDFLKNYYRK